MNILIRDSACLAPYKIFTPRERFTYPTCIFMMDSIVSCHSRFCTLRNAYAHCSSAISAVYRLKFAALHWKWRLSTWLKKNSRRTNKYIGWLIYCRLISVDFRAGIFQFFVWMHRHSRLRAITPYFKSFIYWEVRVNNFWSILNKKTTVGWFFLSILSASV